MDQVASSDAGLGKVWATLSCGTGSGMVASEGRQMCWLLRMCCRLVGRLRLLLGMVVCLQAYREC